MNEMVHGALELPSAEASEEWVDCKSEVVHERRGMGGWRAVFQGRINRKTTALSHLSRAANGEKVLVTNRTNLGPGAIGSCHTIRNIGVVTCRQNINKQEPPRWCVHTTRR